MSDVLTVYLVVKSTAPVSSAISTVLMANGIINLSKRERKKEAECSHFISVQQRIELGVCGCGCQECSIEAEMRLVHNIALSM